MKEQSDIGIELGKQQGDFFIKQFELAWTTKQPAPNHNEFMRQVLFLELAAAQLARIFATHEFSWKTARRIRTKFAGIYNVNQTIADIRRFPLQATDNDTHMSGADDVGVMNPKAHMSTGRLNVQKTTFHPFALSFHPAPKNDEIPDTFPNLHTVNPILFLSPVAMITTPITIHSWGTGGFKKGHEPAHIITASGCYVKTHKDALHFGVHTRTIRVWDDKTTSGYFDRLLELSMQAAQMREYQAKTDYVIYAGRADGNS